MCSQHLLPPLIISLRFRVLQWRVWWYDPQPPVLHDLLTRHSRILPGPFPSWGHAQQPPVYWRRRWIGERLGRSAEPGLEYEQLCLLLDTAAERGKPAEWRLWCCTAGDRWTWQSVSLVRECHCMCVEIIHDLNKENSIIHTTVSLLELGCSTVYQKRLYKVKNNRWALLRWETAPDQSRIWCDSGCLFPRKVWICPVLPTPNWADVSVLFWDGTMAAGTAYCVFKGWFTRSLLSMNLNLLGPLRSMLQQWLFGHCSHDKLIIKL